MSNKKLNIIPYQHHLVEKARKLRNNSTPAEKRLWKYIREKRVNGFDFDRQKPIDRYIVDFYCKELMLAIEIDGKYHDSQYEQDRLRQQRIESFGVHFLRFSEKEVLDDIDNVLRVIEQWVLKYDD
ncbi:endonuclease domain-containing protein [Fodinibius halophilus]|uniref:Endonuclease domain-containing protein n=1 Tax=Fodinibius halophilus TaxID=1736908 RepID=A0A6M1T5B1_9BACT|nr:endonuclease domain-containing protein [Fodinibius halophilus]NGP88445.1 endonuclease domain-containing protein [Fodinibius halophilus]